MKNADLESLLKERGLPHTGKKADMVARLEEDDKKKNNEDEIDWDDDAADASAAPAAPAPVETAAPTAEETETAVDGNNPQAVPNQEAAIDPAATNDLEVKQPEEGASETNGAAKVEEAPKIDYTSGIAATDIDKELEARRRRMERFNIKADEQDDAAAEAQKRLERAKKFGDAAPDTNKLDSALTERRQKRGREGGDERGDFKRGRGRGRGFRGGPRRNGGGGSGGGRGPREERAGGDRGGQWMSESDRAAAEKRKQRFA